MPRYGSSDIAHTASTDHRIPRRPDPDSHPGAKEKLHAVASFYRDRQGANDPDVARDLGMALVLLAGMDKIPVAEGAGHGGDLLELSLRTAPGDLPGWEARGQALILQGRNAEALAAFETVLEKAPQREMALFGAAAASQNLQQLEPALAYWRRAVAVNPWMPDYRRNLTLLLGVKKSWDEVGPECQAWLALDPGNVEARFLWVRYLVQVGRKEEARAEFAKLRALEPPQFDQLEAWFNQAVR